MKAWRLTVPGEPATKQRPRFRKETGHTYTPERTISAESHVKASAYSQMGQPLLEGPLIVELTFFESVPKSWSAKRRAGALSGRDYPTSRIDIDNMCKLVLDALNGVLWRDDKQVVDLHAKRRFSDAPRTELEVRHATPADELW